MSRFLRVLLLELFSANTDLAIIGPRPVATLLWIEIEIFSNNGKFLIFSIILVDIFCLLSFWSCVDFDVYIVYFIVFQFDNLNFRFLLAIYMFTSRSARILCAIVCIYAPLISIKNILVRSLTEYRSFRKWIVTDPCIFSHFVIYGSENRTSDFR